MNDNFFDIISSPDGSGQVGGQSYILGRVAHIVYGPYYPGTTIPDPNYTNPTDLGKILFEILNGTQSSTFNSLGNEPAKPLFFWMKQYPTLGEYVHIVAGPSLGLNENTNQKSYYYLPPFNLWGAVNHNALPNLTNYNEHVNAVKVNYQQNKVTNQTSNLTTGSIEYPLGNNFPEKPNIKSLEMFVADVAFESRLGSSIRFGSSLKSNRDKNYWWDGPEGNPITIIRNGQGKQVDQEGWIPTVENINRDPSSIYLTNGQVVVLDDLKNFSLSSFGIEIVPVNTQVIPLNQQLTSIESLSPIEQDRRTNSQNPNVIA